MTKSPQYPKKNLASYIIPFLLILLLLGSGLTIVQQKIDFSDVLELFQAPSVAKDDKVKLVYQEGTNQIYPKSKEQWQELNEDSFIQVADTIKVDSGGVVVLRLFEGSELRLTGGTQLKLIRLDQDALQGNHITAELLSGQLWGRINKGNTGDADVILLTSHQTIQIHETTLIDILASPETSRVIAGSALVNVGQKSESGPRTRLGTLTLLSAQQTLLDELAIDQLKGGDQDLVSALDDSYLASEWFQWNVEQEKKLGLISDVNFDALQGAMEVPLVELESGLVSVSSPKADAAVGSKVLVEGAYDDDQIDHIFVNGQEATLGLDGTWELVVPLSLARNKIVVSARELDSADKKMVANFTVKVDEEGPLLGKILLPAIDANDNAELSSEELELRGEIGSDAVRVCVVHNEDEPYCLKQFRAGDKTYRYAGSIGYGNVSRGKNKYAIRAYDQFDNVSQKVIYIFQGVAKPDARVEEETAEDSTSPKVPDAPSAELPKPVITDPDPTVTFQTDEPELRIRGTVSAGTQAIYVNDKRASFQAGSDSFELTITLEMGENNIRVQAGDGQGNKSKTALLRAVYIEAEAEE